MLRLIQFVDRFPLVPMPKGALLQPIDTGEVAGRLAELALSGRAGHVPDVCGPEVRTAAELARAYFAAAGRKRRVVEVPIPGGIVRAFRKGAHVAPERAYGRIRWEDFLERTVGPKGTDKTRKENSP